MVSIGICAKILSTIASPALKMAYEKGLTIWEAENELNKLRLSIETLQAFLNDAENRQEDSDLVRNWIQRLKGVLYDAEDLFDEVLTEDLCKQQMMDRTNMLSLKNKVRVYCSKLNPIVSRNSISKKVKAIRERLAEISADMNQFTFVKGQPNCKRSESYTARCYIDAKLVIGRDLYKDSIMEMLFNALPDITDAPVVIAIDGIGGMGKTTLAHLIYSDEKVGEFFEKRGFACISKPSNDKEFFEKVYQSISEENCSGLTLIQLQEKLKKSLKDKKYLLVLDDVWEDDHVKWTSRKSVLSSGSNGSRIIVTTRLVSVVRAMKAIEGHNLEGLSEDESWELFKNLSFAPGYENEPRRESVGRKLLKKCRGVPLAISCMCGLLYDKTIREWEDIERVGLPMLKGMQNDDVISILKLSFDYLPPNLKRCFIYCCLFPKDYRYNKHELIYHWIAQGYINLDEEEYSFMGLLRMGFFQEVEKDELGEVKSCKMHDIMHDLALHLKGEEIIPSDSTNVSNCTRHVSLIVDGEEGRLWNIPTPLLDSKLIRSCILSSLSSLHSQPNVDQLCSNFKLLRTLVLAELEIEHIPPSIGELKLVRYLDLSWNDFERLPDSIANLVNLIILVIKGCSKLGVWPLNFKKLINLRSLVLKETDKLLSMPEGIGGMGSLQNLSDFKVDKWSQLHEFYELSERLRGSLVISFDEGMEVGDQGRWQLPDATSLQELRISFYPGHGIWGWGNNASKMVLQRLVLEGCKNVNHLPPMSCLPCLKWLEIRNMPKLEYIEESEPEELNHRNPATSQEFFPSLEKLILINMRKLMGWRRKVADEAAFFEFSHLSELVIKDCPNLELKSFPQCPHLRSLDLRSVGTTSAIFLSSNCASLEEIRIFNCEFLSGIPSEALTSLRKLAIEKCGSLKSLQLASPHLLDLMIEDCGELESIELGQTPSLQSLHINNCRELESIELAQTQSLQSLHINNCRELESIELAQTQSLQSLHINNCPELESIELAQTPSLQRLVIRDCQRLKSLQPVSSPHLLAVQIEYCGRTLKSLNIGCSGLASRSMSSLRDISIRSCTGLITLPWTDLTSLESCSFWDIDGLQSVHIPSPHLRRVYLNECVGLTSVEVQAPTEFGIINCSELKNFCIAQPTALRSLEIKSISSAVDWGSLMAALTSLENFRVDKVSGLKMLNFKSPHLRQTQIYNCSELISVEIESPFTDPHSSSVRIQFCSQLKNVRVPRQIALQLLVISECPELSWSSGVDWASLTNLNELYLRPLPPVEEVLLQLPQCLRQRYAIGDLEID